VAVQTGQAPRNERDWAALRPDATAASITPLNRPGWALRTLRQDRVRRRRRPDGAASPAGPVAALRSLRPPLTQPVFVVGAPRSGTTFLGECFAAVPSVSYHYEPYATQAAARMLVQGEWDEDTTAAYFRATYRHLLQARLAGGRRLVDKTPAHAFVLPFLARAFPDAHFVHLLRDGRDAALSLTERHWIRAAWGATGRRYPTGELQGPFPQFFVEPERREQFAQVSDLHRAVWVWRLHTEAARAAAGALGQRLVEVRYEDLVRDPAGQAGRLTDRLGLSGPDARAFLDHAVTIRSGSVARWRTAFGPLERVTVEQEAGDLLRRLGYDGQDDDAAPTGGVARPGREL